MSVYIIGYDLHPSKGETYEELLNAIQQVGQRPWHCLDSTWLVITTKTALQIANELTPHLHDDDQLLVMNYGEKKDAAWYGFTGKCDEWLKGNL